MNTKRNIKFVILFFGLLLLSGCAKTNIVNEAQPSAASAISQISEDSNTQNTNDTKQTEDTHIDNSSISKETKPSEEKNDVSSATEITPSLAHNGAYVLARPSTNGILSVNGNQLMDQYGNSVQLRGFSTHGLAWFPAYVNADCFFTLSQDFHANLIRLAMYTSENGGYCSADGNKSYLKRLLLDGVQYAKDADMYVIIDWHILHDNNPLTNQTEAISFFDDMTKELQDETHVIFEICNEPNSGTSWEDVKSYANTVIPVIRNNMPNAIILVGTPTWCQEIDKPQKDPLTDFDNIMYTLHFYAATHKEELRDKLIAAIASGTPVFVSEFGLCDASGNGNLDLNQAQKWIDLLDENGISYANWSLCNKDESASLLKSSCSKTSGFVYEDLSDSGKWMYDMLCKNIADISSSSTFVDDHANIEHASSIGIQQGLELDVAITGSWESDGETFYQYNLSIKNTNAAAVNNWSVTLPFSDTFTLSDGWNGEYSVSDKQLIIQSKDYNAQIDANATITDIGFIISGTNKLSYIE